MNVLLRIPEKHWLTIAEAAQAHAETFPANSPPRSAIFKALLRVKHLKPVVRVAVRGGVAYITRCPSGVAVKIRDYDNEQNG